jgi:prophage regulatory protein
MGAMNDVALLRLPTVEQLSGYKRANIYRLIKEGKFPAPVRLAGGGAVAWRSAEIRAWIEAQGATGAKQGVA